MTTTKLVRDGFNIPMPKPGDGTRLMCRPDGSLYCSWDRPAARMALDSAIGGPKGSPNYASSNATDDIDLNTPDSTGDDLRDKIHQLLAGKVDDADIETLLALIEGPDDTPAQDRKRGGRQAHDRRPAMPSRAEILRRVAASGEVRAQRVLEQNAKLMGALSCSPWIEGSMSQTIDRPLTVVAARQLLRDTSRLPSERIDQAHRTVEQFYASRPPAHQRCVACGHQRWSEHSAGDDVAWACSGCRRAASLTSDEWRDKRAEQAAAQQAAAKAAEVAAATAPKPRVILKQRLEALAQARSELQKLEAAAPVARSRVWGCQAAVETAEAAAEEANAGAAENLAAALVEGKPLGPASTASKARAALGDALSVASSARVLLEEKLKTAQLAVGYAADKCKKAARAVIAAERMEDLISDAVEARAAYVDAIGGLAWLLRQHAVPDGDSRVRQLVAGGNTPPSAWPESATAGIKVMQDAFEALMLEAGAVI
jgi:hypothetical protein